MRTLITLICCLGLITAYPQGLVIKPGTQFKTSSGVNIVSHNMNVVNNGDGDLSGANLVFTGNGFPKLGGTGIIAMKDLSVNKIGGNVLLQSHISVNGQLQLVKGIIDLNGQRINLSPLSIIIGESESNRVIGTAGDISITVNLNAPSSENPGNLGLVISSFGNLGSTVIRRGHDAITTNAIKRYYEVIPANNTNLNASIRFQYFDTELNNQNEGFLNLVKRNGGNNFVALGSDGRSTVTNFVGKNNLNELGTFTLVGPANSLPVKFILFNSSCEGNSTRLIWKTAAELNSKRFDIERSVDGLNWQVVGSVAAAGNSTVERTYTYSGNSVTESLYRIVEYDINDQKSYTPVIRASCSSADEFKLWPNPVTSIANVSLKSTQSGEAVFSLIDAKGSLVLQLRKGILAGMNQVMLDFSKLPAGVYTLRANWNGTNREIKLIKK